MVHCNKFLQNQRSSPGRQDVFVLQFFGFRKRHWDDNVVDTEHTVSLTFVDKALEETMKYDIKVMHLQNSL